MARLRVLLLAVSMLLAPPAGLAQSDADSTNALILSNARLVMPAEKTVERGALRIDGQTVTGILDRIPPEFDGRVLDVHGRWVLPGLVDAHVHSWGNMGATYRNRQLLQTTGTAKAMLYSGVTAFLDLFSPEDYIFEVRNRQRRDGLLGADIYAAGPILTCPNGHGTEYGVPTRTVATPADARATVDSLVRRAPDVVKLVYHPYETDRHPSMDRRTMTSIVESAAAHEVPTVAHVETWRGAYETVEAGVDAITHTPPSVMPDSLVAAMKQHDTAWIPTLAVHTEAAHLVEHPDRLENDLLQSAADSSLLASYRDTSALPDQMHSWIQEQRAHRATRLASVRKGHRAGLSIVAGTDAGNPGLFQGYSLHRELQLYTAAGLSEWAALRSAITAPARFLDAPFGLQPGDRANLVLLDASPLEDIRNTQEIHRVIYRGTVVDRAHLLHAVKNNGPSIPTP